MKSEEAPGVTITECASCVDERGAGAAFCEACGRPLTAARPDRADRPLDEVDQVDQHDEPRRGEGGRGEGGRGEGGRDGGGRREGGAADDRACPACGTPAAIGVDGYCGHCGMLAGRPRDHLESVAGAAAAVTDRGRRHHRNEDAVFLGGPAGGIDVVICDGVSASFDPDVASELAAETAGQLLTGSTQPLPARVAAALTAAATAVAALARTGDPRRAASNPACTVVAACVRGAEVGYGWVGDSRAYWLPASGDIVALTEDDSWAAHAIALGADPQAAWRDPKAHAITAWLGADAGPVTPRTDGFTAPGPGHLVLCSDGLWNYLAEPTTFGDTVRAHLAAAAGAPHPLLAAARSLTAFANEAGGADNITVALIPVELTPAS
ncbi:serine/threonine protein phosphatase PrpC [Krasilnikovia cinnamomea]|uniref:Serine/threonine protein phosphatase PrpC n=1 Tax=Krasilnikovia cinnamomea TaxID=349313 RepID=A0A4Q7ZCZ1_9ACTN|nr:PP2C family serine/threonine-protein phosphatase [Krasilnikovia cinnamomea]RZU48508.1 serine/threonine protein phosphatase PrpC [Krasilnikovia cinnamomea]